MNIQVRVCIQSVHHHHAHMISDGHASIDDVSVKVKTNLHQAFLQVVDLHNLRTTLEPNCKGIKHQTSR